MTYHYFGLLLGKLKATVVLLSASAVLGGSHAAVWLGVSNPDASRWVQAGVSVDSAALPFEYVETNTDGQPWIMTWSATYGRRAHVRLLHRGRRWRVVIDGHESQWIRLRRGRPMVALETLGHVRAAARIDGRLVFSH